MHAAETGRGVLALVGPRAAGKSAAGALLARGLACDFVDLDAETLACAAAVGIVHASAGELLAAAGLERFREWEAQALLRVASQLEPGVLATGGGAVETASNRRWLRAHALCVWLDATPDVLVARMEAADQLRPPLTKLSPADEVRELRRRREPLYAEVAALRIDTSAATVEEVVAAVNERVVFDRRGGSVFRTKGGA